MNYTWILAQSEGITEQPVTSEQTEAISTIPADPNAAAPAARPQSLFGNPILMLGLLFVMMYFLLFRGPRKKQQQHKQMVQSLKKNDKVRTIGGLIGTVVDIKPDEITLKVDESNNTKIKVLPSAIGKSMSQDDL